MVMSDESAALIYSELESKGQTVIPGEKPYTDTEKKHERHDLDFYITPMDVAVQGCAILERAIKDASAGRVWNDAGGCIVDPCAGTGRFEAAARTHGFASQWKWQSSDIVLHDDPAPEVSGIIERDYLGPYSKAWKGDYDAIGFITNPPFKLAQAIIERCLLFANGRPVVMLLRTGFAAGQGRYAFNARYTPDIHFLTKRPSFTGNGKTDGYEYAYFVWHRNTRGQHFWIKPGS